MLGSTDFTMGLLTSLSMAFSMFMIRRMYGGRFGGGMPKVLIGNV